MELVETPDKLTALFALPPFGIEVAKKQRLLLTLINESFSHHFRNCPGYQRFCRRRGLTADTTFNSLFDVPFLPVQAFKEYGNFLQSVPPENIKVILQSS